mgnify:CR=1 FL=1
MGKLRSKNAKEIKAYFVGGGIASLAGAAFLIRDGHMPGKNIHIFEELKVAGGALDASGDPEKGYVFRGGRMLNNPVYESTWNLFESIPSLSDPTKTIRDDVLKFNADIVSPAKARLIDENGEVVYVSTLGFNNLDRLALGKLAITPEETLGTTKIEELFSHDFFKTNFWYMWATTFAFQPWHSAVEFKRYMLRFMHEFSRLDSLIGVTRTTYNQYDSVILPLKKWLEEHGVNFVMNTVVTDLDFKSSNPEEKTVERIYCISNGLEKEIEIRDDDLVFVTNGSMVESSSLGSMTTAPKLKKKGSSWKLWENIAKKKPDMGNPEPFADHIDGSKWVSFTMTFNDTEFFDSFQNFTGRAAATLKDSNWFLTYVLPYQPHYINQPDNVKVGWGYGLSVDQKGNYVDKKMSDCNGEEILTELMCNLQMQDKLPSLLKTTTCIPCMMPYITAHFMPRIGADRPHVIPQGSTNLAFIGQYCEVPGDVTFTVEYSVRSAQMAVYGLLDLDKIVTPINKHQYDVRVIMNSLMESFK